MLESLQENVVVKAFDCQLPIKHGNDKLPAYPPHPGSPLIWLGARVSVSLNESFSPNTNPIFLHNEAGIDSGKRQTSPLVEIIARNDILHLKINNVRF